MLTLTLNPRQKKIIEEIPLVSEYSHLYFYTTQSDSNSEFIAILDSVIGLSDTVLSKWLNITPRTFRNYRNSTNLILKENTKEHVILILSLYKHGIELFDTVENFESWLSKNNPVLDNRAPIEFLETISGIKFIDDRLTAMEFGENV